MSLAFNIVLMMMSGFFVNGPYALITTAVSADLGTHESLAGEAASQAAPGSSSFPRLSCFLSWK